MANDDDSVDLDALLEDAAEEVMQQGRQASHEEDADEEEDLLEAAAADVLSSVQQPPPNQPPQRAMLGVPTRGRGAGAPGESPKAPPPTLEEALQAVLPAEIAAKWVAVVQEDAAQGKQEECAFKPLSYAYRAFTEGGGRKQQQPKKRPATAAEEEEEGEEKRQAVGAVLPELILRAGTAAGVRDTEGLRAGLKAHEAATARLQRLFVEQVARDLRPLVEEDGDFDAGRFPATAAKILGGAAKEGASSS